MINCLHRVVQMVVCAGLIFGGPAHASGWLDSIDDPDTAYLSFTYVEINRNQREQGSKLQLEFARVITTTDNDQIPARLVLGRNPLPSRPDEPAIFSFCTYPPLQVTGDQSVNMIVNDWILHDDPILKRKIIVGAGYRGDSAYIFRLDRQEDDYRNTLLTIGRDGNGDGLWLPQIFIPLVEDYDDDDHVEAFIYVNSVREANSRLLFCVDLETMAIEWQLAVSAILSHRNFIYSCRDSLSPALIFLALNPFQGKSDENFSDSLKYLSIVNAAGDLKYNKVISTGVDHSRIIRGENDSLFYVLHAIPPTDPNRLASLVGGTNLDSANGTQNYLSKITSRGELLKTVSLSDMPRDFWLEQYGPDGDTCLFVRLTTDMVQVYDHSLNVLDETKKSGLRQYIGRAAIAGMGDVLMFQNGLYTPQLTQLVQFPVRAITVEPLVIDQTGATRTVVLDNPDFYSIGEIRKRDFWELASIFYVRNRNYVLTALSISCLALLLINYYRRKTKKNLVLVAQQKMLLEQAHEDLQKAQKTIIAHERFRQAQDIAGGFAHEIRNALFPARSALSRMLRADRTQLSELEWSRDLLKFSDDAVARAVDITQLISTYTKLEAARQPVPVDIGRVLEDVLTTNKFRIEEQGITVDVSGKTGQDVAGNREQLILVLNNVIINALDALTETGDPTILVTIKQVDCYLEVRVADNGPGIDPENIDKVFDVFYSTKPSSGTGIGLAMVKKIVEMYGGSVAVSSTPREGTSIILRLKIDT